MRESLLALCRRLNLPKVVCDHLLGQGHSTQHRMVTGVCVMVVGVSIAKSGHAIDSTVWLLTADVIGYGLHGMGFIPYAEYLLHNLADHPQDKE